MQKPLTLIIALGLTNLVLGGCAGTKESVLPQDGPSMKAIYEQHTQEMSARDPLAVRETLGKRPIVNGADALAGYTRKAYDEIDTVFPRLPNPSLVMYVFPHLVDEGSGSCEGGVFRV